MNQDEGVITPQESQMLSYVRTCGHVLTGVDTMMLL